MRGYNVKGDGVMEKKDDEKWVVLFDDTGTEVQWGHISSKTIQNSVDTCAYVCLKFETERGARNSSGNASRC
ncbi:MAG: hypothetical protein UR66_C0001G0088 [Candidatus Moranbacteria bacterium GW2011_GWE1_35_17]|nr:MAG: hypothetical protein UR66_C0001G0088 [Candidatus Moranbacteria bacterium GW2011_GWE1_35_17]KKP72753.1 MAG: hypothetical protein UR65_C0012G0018 [Candidatus Moranbacteria bacterium GW2011_GWE2_35_164]KKP81151.1 MAG: hypothetical protein UR82_C0071G0011 [Candidatus Moranbacteria bacterium GW2011_GWF1_35_5]KKP85193.1 MAG: hypothetical protein UR83_C0003G0028 [Candidatus Moranbacteria bacterium GW2011_GWF2_35_54]